MLKVSGLFVLLCGLLASSSAQEVLSQITNALTQELLSEGFLPSLQTIELQSSLKNVFSPATDLLDISRDSNFRIQLRDPELLQVSLQDSHNNNEAELLVALLFSIQVKFPALNSLLFQVRTNMKIQLHLEKDVDGRYLLAFGHCRLVPESVWIEPRSLNTRISNFVVGNVEKILKNLIINNLGANVCPLINSWLYNLNPQVANELINVLLQHSSHQVAI
ncbi:latherin [Camelus dromedarius]|uniref:latherin-like n=1 Tax=Camelus bactrianus TaxID=9837 RepID=UPI00057BC697|nr:latherin-like [Camelus dromedarius]